MIAKEKYSQGLIPNQTSISMSKVCKSVVVCKPRIAQSCPTLCNPMNCTHQAPRPRDSPGKNTGVGYHFLLQGIFPTQGPNLLLLHFSRILYQWATKPISSRVEILVDFLSGGWFCRPLAFSKAWVTSSGFKDNLIHAWRHFYSTYTSKAVRSKQHLGQERATQKVRDAIQMALPL